MEFGLDEDQQELASLVRSLLGRRADSAAVRAATESDPGYDVDLWQVLCEQVGVAGLAVPEEHEGSGFSTFETLVVLEELGRSLSPTPLLASLVTTEALLASGSEESCQRLLPGLAAGGLGTLVSSAVGGPGRPFPAPETVSADGSTLNGSVTNVLFGDQADVLLVAARTADGATALFEVAPEHVTRTRTPAMDTTLRLATLTFDNCPGTLVTADASAALARACLVGTVATAALQVGCAQRALDMTVAYSKERVQFGRPIGSFQALKHRMADMLVLLEMSRSIFWAAAHAAADSSDEAGRLAAVAGSYCGDALHHIASETVQLHGGIAITWEHDAAMVFKRAHALGQLFGQPHQHRAALVS